MDNISIEISIPADGDGFVLLQCQRCGEKFKLTPKDIESEEVKDIYCPLCGLTSDNYFTKDVIEYAQAKALNEIMGNFHEEMKKSERKTKNSMLQIKAGKFEKEYEKPVKSTINSMEIVKFECCNKSAKIKHLLKYSGGYCPFCGGLYGNN